MNIYNHTCFDRTPYTYLIGWLQHNKWYYGVRYSKNCRPNDLWIDYKTSSIYVKKFVLEFGDPDIIQVRKVFDNIKKAQLWEEKVLQRMKVIKEDKWLNKNNVRAIEDQTGSIKPKQSKAMKGRKHWNKNGETTMSFDCPGEGWLKGRLPFSDSHLKNMKGLRCWNNGLVTIKRRYNPGPEWTLGRLK